MSYYRRMENVQFSTIRGRLPLVMVILYRVWGGIEFIVNGVKPLTLVYCRHSKGVMMRLLLACNDDQLLSSPWMYRSKRIWKKVGDSSKEVIVDRENSVS